MNNELKFNSKDYWETIRASGLIKAERNLLIEIFTSYFECGTPPPINEENFNRFTEGLPKILANGIEIKFVLIDDKTRVIAVPFKQKPPIDFHKRRKPKTIGISSKRRRKRF